VPPRCQHCPNLADERSFMCEDCAGRADAEVVGLRDLLADVATSGVEFDDPRIGYVSVQIDRETWEALAPYRPEGQSFVPMLKGP
jgi:hypothetical protein